jgi:hypothetical protein
MIDFVGSPAVSVLEDLSRTLATEFSIDCRLAVFETGRSFHGYMPAVIEESVWPKYLGRLLTSNETDRTPIIDTRWIGHALVRGFSALRWSHNTSRYLQMPHVAMFIDTNETRRSGVAQF